MSNSSMFMLFYYLDPLQNQAIVTSRCMHYIFCRGRKVKQADQSVLPVTEKEGKGKGKWTICPRMKKWRANLCLFWAQTNSWSCVLKLSFLFACTMSAMFEFLNSNFIFEFAHVWSEYQKRSVFEWSKVGQMVIGSVVKCHSRF